MHLGYSLVASLNRNRMMPPLLRKTEEGLAMPSISARSHRVEGIPAFGFQYAITHPQPVHVAEHCTACPPRRPELVSAATAALNLGLMSRALLLQCKMGDCRGSELYLCGQGLCSIMKANHTTTGLRRDQQSLLEDPRSSRIRAIIVMLRAGLVPPEEAAAAGGSSTCRG